MTWKPASAGEAARQKSERFSTHIDSFAETRDIVTVSESLSPDRTNCSVRHHPSLSPWCDYECAGFTRCERLRKDDDGDIGKCGRRYHLGARNGCEMIHLPDEETPDYRPDLQDDPPSEGRF